MTRSALIRIASLTSVAAVAVTGCSVPVDTARVLTGALLPFDACEDVLSYLKTEALARVGPYGLDQGGRGIGFAGRDVAESATGAEAGAVAPGAAPTIDEAHSTTNVQEAGVDEPDLVKTDGNHIYSVVDGTFRVIDVAANTEVGTLDLTTDAASSELPRASELLLEDDRALVITRAPMVWLDAPRAMPGWGGWQSSRLVTVDLSDPSDPTQLSSLDIEGEIVSARLVDGTVRLAVRSEPTLEFPWDETVAEDEAALTQRNRAVVEMSQLTDWLPSASWTSTEADEEPTLLVPCERLSYPREFSGFSTVSVLSLPIDGDLQEPNGTAVLGSGDTVYASQDRFYVATNGWTPIALPVDLPVPPPDVAQDLSIAIMPPGGPGVDTQRTGIHAFDITDSGPARYVGSGEVPGRLIGQYALSEWEGNLRIASTTGSSWGPNEQSESRVTVLAEQDEGLVEIGMVDGLGKSEQIYAVRYVGVTAYVVTFRQTDPLYVLDLADPTEPTVRGELKITGYSAYLHPVSDGLVVGVGQEANTDGRQVGAQVSLFDVSDPTSPTKLAGHVVRDGYSEAEYEARAFLYWDATGALVIPMSTGKRTGALVLTVGDKTLTEVGWVTASEESSAAKSGEAVRRSLVIGDLLFTVWSDGIQSNELDTLTDPTWIPYS